MLGQETTEQKLNHLRFPGKKRKHEKQARQTSMDRFKRGNSLNCKLPSISVFHKF